MKSLVTVIILLVISYIAFPQQVYQPEAESEQNGANYGLKPGYKGIFEIGYGIPAGDNGENRVKLSMVNGIQFNPYTSLGVGIGLSGYYDRVLVPVFADFRFYLLNENVTPYLSSDIGCSFGDSYYPGGFLWNIMIGINFNLSRIISMHLGIGYDSQKMDWWNWTISHPVPGGSYRTVESNEYMSGAVLINFGFSF